MHRQHWKRAIAATLTSLATAAMGTPILLGQTAESVQSIPASLQNLSSANSGPIQYLPFAHFNIPFEVDASGPLPREVHLWVSPDQGRSWLKYASTTPDKRSFEFHAAAEGEYLFAVQTRDSQGDSALTASPPMRILIDTTQPELQLSVDVSPAGRLVIDYRLSDAFLAENSVRLAHCVDGQSQWQDVPMGSFAKAGDNWSGRCEVDMPHCRELDVRITATDLAQNKAEKIVRFSAPRTASASSGMQLASQRGDAPASNSNWSVAAPPTKPPHSAQRNPQAFPGNQAVRPVAAQPGAGLIASQGAVAWNPSESASSRSLSGWTSGPSSTTAARTIAVQPIAGQPAQSNNGSRVAAAPNATYEELPAPPPTEDSGATGLELSPSSATTPGVNDRASGRQLPVARREIAGIDLGGASAANKGLAPNAPSDVAPSLDAQRSAVASSDSAANSAQVSPEPFDIDPGIASEQTSIDDAYHSRSRAFSLDYAVDSLRGATVSDIELWGTEDQGRTWQKWGSDPDRQSPFDVQVGNDGMFGFRMVVIGANGLVSNRPQDGDAADMWINVDTQMPTVNITRALYGEGDQAGMLVIEFNGSDDNLHERPVTLSYSERPSGPWVTIASGLASSGQYHWKADPSLPKQVFLRAQAVDRAGNTQEHRLELPVSLRGIAPQGRIQGFRPIEAK